MRSYVSISTVCFGRRDKHAGQSVILNSQLAAKSEAKPVGCIVAKQNEVNHCCEQEKENTLSHEDATRVEYQPDFVKLCHVLYSPFTKRTKAV